MEGEIMSIITIGIDPARNVLTVQGIGEFGKAEIVLSAEQQGT